MPKRKRLMEQFSHAIDRAYKHHQEQQKIFYFYTDHGNYTGCSAQTLDEFLAAMSTVPLSSLEFHLNGGDFERWITEKGDPKLVQQFTELRKEPYERDQLRETLSKMLQSYLSN